MTTNNNIIGHTVERIPPTPHVNDETAAFWAAANEHRFLLRRCRDTGKAYYFPRERSPFTGSLNTEWCDASGNATLYSFSVLVRTDTPYCLAYVQLDEGPIILSNLCQTDFTQLRIGQRLRVVFLASADGQKIPMFTPA
jgi:uncharacterized protein